MSEQPPLLMAQGFKVTTEEIKCTWSDSPECSYLGLYTCTIKVHFEFNTGDVKVYLILFSSKNLYLYITQIYPEM